MAEVETGKVRPCSHHSFGTGTRPERDRNATGTRPERDRNATGTRPERDRNATGTRPERDRNATGTRPERDRNATGTRPERDRNATGTQPERNRNANASGHPCSHPFHCTRSTAPGRTGMIRPPRDVIAVERVRLALWCECTTGCVPVATR